MVMTMNVSTDGWSSLQGLLTKYHFLYIYNSGAEHDRETWWGNYLLLDIYLASMLVQYWVIGLA